MSDYRKKKYRQITDEELEHVLSEHAEWLLSGGLVERKNVWEPPTEGAGIQGRRADLSNTKLAWFDLCEACLEGANLCGAILECADLTEANLAKADLSFAYLAGTSIINANLYGARMEKACLVAANLMGANLFSAHLNGADLREVLLINATLYLTDMSRTDVSDSRLDGACLKWACLDYAKLGGACLEGAGLSYARLSCAVLDRAILFKANLSWATLRNASLREAKVNGADFLSAKLVGADLTAAKLTEVKNLDPGQLAGTNLTHAELPPHLAAFDNLQTVAETAKANKRLFNVLLLGGVYSLLALFLWALGDTSSVRLPFLPVDMKMPVFFGAAPALLLAIYIYFQLGMQRTWEALATLPAIFPDGSPLYRRAYPWLPLGYAQAHYPIIRQVKLKVAPDEEKWAHTTRDERLPKYWWWKNLKIQGWLQALGFGCLYPHRPILSRVQVFLVMLLVWWFIPATLVIFWWQHLAEASPGFHAFHISLFGAACTVAMGAQYQARRTLRMEDEDEAKSFWAVWGWWVLLFGVLIAGMIATSAFYTLSPELHLPPEIWPGARGA